MKNIIKVGLMAVGILSISTSILADGPYGPCSAHQNEACLTINNCAARKNQNIFITTQNAFSGGTVTKYGNAMSFNAQLYYNSQTKMLTPSADDGTKLWAKACITITLKDGKKMTACKDIMSTRPPYRADPKTGDAELPSPFMTWVNGTYQWKSPMFNNNSWQGFKENQGTRQNWVLKGNSLDSLLLYPNEDGGSAACS